MEQGAMGLSWARPFLRGSVGLCAPLPHVPQKSCEKWVKSVAALALSSSLQHLEL